MVSTSSGKESTKRILIFLIFLFAAASRVWAVSDLRGFHRSGQTFLTWKEDLGRAGESYRIYRSSLPFTTSSDLLPKYVVATLPEDTSLYYSDLCRGVQDQEQYRPLTRYIIEEKGSQLSAGTGLFVFTAEASGTYYYAITQIFNNSEDKKLEPGSTTGAMNETVERPKPVLVWKSGSGLSRIYTHWMNYKAWNATFDAPRSLNNYCGQSPQQAGVRKAVQYAYSYLVALPRGYNPASEREYPLAVYLHGFNERYLSRGEPERYGWQIIELVPDDPNNSWWFGFGEKTDYRADAGQKPPVVNFTELRILEELNQVIELPGIHVDTGKIYAHGQSMGGTGALALGLRYPQIFSQVYAGQPHTNFRVALPRYRDDLARKWGPPSTNFPISIRGENAAELLRWNGTRVWDWQNFPREVLRRKADDTSFIMVDHGTEDTTALWYTQGLPFYNALHASKRPFYAWVNGAGHSWQNFVARAYNGFSYAQNVFPVVDEAMISFTTPSTSRPDPFYGRLFEWANSARRFGRPIEDTETRFGVAIRTNFRETLIADVTPRRLRAFKVLKGDRFRWHTKNAKSETTLQQGTIEATQLNVLTIPKVKIEPAGVRLILEKLN